MINEEIIKNAQYRKSLAIAFFSATNAAIELVKNLKGGIEKHQLQETIIYWRDWFLEEHKRYYATVITNIGKNYDVAETIKKLKAAKTLEELRIAWQFLSEDERQDKEIIKIKAELKEKYEKK